MLDRMDRICETIKREISFILASEIDDPRVQGVTVVRAEVSRDLREARIYCVIPAENMDKKDGVLKGLKRSASHVRGSLAKKIAMKYVPRLTFLEEKRDQKAHGGIDEIFARLEKEKKEKEMKKKLTYMLDNDDMKAVVEAIKGVDNFLITAHINPEGDSVGSQLAMYHILKQLGKTAVMVNHDVVPDNLRFLKGSGLITDSIPEGFVAQACIVLDCPVMERTGVVESLLAEGLRIINIDHHVSNSMFGSVNWVAPEASSVGEMIYHLIAALGAEISEEVAEPIYTAIVTDTGRFNYDNTTSVTHAVAGELITRGVDPKRMYSQIFEKKSFEEIKVLGSALSTLKLEAGGAIAYMYITREMCEREGVSAVSTDEFINYPRSIKGVKVAIFFKENGNHKNKINVSFRSAGDVNVNKIAAGFGGGGHPLASGCVFERSLEEAIDIVIKEVKKVVFAEEGAGNGE
ncbi:MAG: 30S ribosome-binding factor RbfA [Candidatus Omnitrophica bacterium]|nr:30S ribosome-binding factor RbfA [Candidatus Omnitrophota bacterium]MDD5488670.1 30S ribosome-binding factor RbfA [Candidatus Omnitrophota bacterium]